MTNVNEQVARARVRSTHRFSCEMFEAFLARALVVSRARRRRFATRARVLESSSDHVGSLERHPGAAPV